MTKLIKNLEVSLKRFETISLPRVKNFFSRNERITTLKFDTHKLSYDTVKPKFHF